MKKLMTHFLIFTLVFHSMGSFMPEARAQGFDPFAASSNVVDMDSMVADDSGGDADFGDEECAGLTDGECALLKNAELLAFQRAACDDGKGGIEVGHIKEELEHEGRTEVMDIDCNQIASLEYKLLEPEVGSDMAFQCVTKNWYMEEEVAFAKELELPMAEKYCREKIENPKPPKEKAAECAGGLLCNMFKTPLGDAIGFDPISDIIKYAAGNSSFGKGCAETPGSGCISNVLWGLFKNIFSNIEGIWDLGKLLVKGVVEGGKWVVKKAAEGVEWVGNKIKDGWNALSNWWNGTEEAEDSTSARSDVVSGMSDETLNAHVEDSTNAVGSMATGLLTGLFDMIKEGTKDNFMCGGDYYKYEGNFTDADYGTRKTKQNMLNRGWEEITNFGGENEPSRHDKIRCDQPFIAECASCGQWMNMVCGLVGFLGGEVITAVLTGGAVNVIGKGAKAAGAGAKVVTGAIKAKVGQSAKWQKLMSAGSKGMKGLKGAYQGGTKLLGSIPGSKLATGIMKNGGKLAMVIGKKVVGLGKGAGKVLLGALKKGRDLALKNRLAKGIGKSKPAQFVKGYFKALDDAFVYGMQGKKGLQIARMARETNKVQREINALKKLADGGDESARALMMAKSQRLETLKQHQALTKQAYGAADDASRARYLDEAKRHESRLDELSSKVSQAQRNHDEALRLAKASKKTKGADNGTTVARANNSSVNPVGSTSTNVADNADDFAKLDDTVNPGRNFENQREVAARTGMRNSRNANEYSNISRKVASKQDWLTGNSKMMEKMDDLGKLKGGNGQMMTETQQSYARAIMNNADESQRAEMMKKIIDDGWDSLRRSCK